MRSSQIAKAKRINDVDGGIAAFIDVAMLGSSKLIPGAGVNRSFLPDPAIAMTYSQWKRLPEADRVRLCQSLNPMEHWDLFKRVEREFLVSLGVRHGVESAFCGFGAGLGPLNAITVRVRSGRPSVSLPKHFMGFPVIRSRRR